ncbi:PREDICTED: peptide transporter family 1-like isoform X1 [Ceratosolen solmsi marchali]|uniref:Oligopeptide transporter 1 n=2 Tax=Ceratosolen solmsi marchali TaxID=326594 RepID=A0AAJ6YCV2_9HYME|nr:PREDICTED: peptide transporter family 1-like isoform X1 [Ceratosolen solmsi marchali]
MAVPAETTVVVNAEKMGYPKSIFFIISNEFCERFSFYGMRTALSLYLVDVLMYNEDTATVMYHTFSMLAYFFPLLGAMIADSWLGKYRTILYLSCVYALGQLLLSVSSVQTLSLPVRELSILSLILIALGTGGIKPCVTAFGGDQFKLPEQEVYLSTFFSLFYFAINSGSLLSTFITPILRKDVTCFGENTCYSLAFFIPAVLMIISVAIFFSGKRLYRIKEPEGNVIFTVTSCICYAIFRKIKSKEKRDNWLDHSDNRYSKQTIEDIKSVLKVLKLFIPLPIFWALFDQQGSRWTFQATRMNGEIFGYLVKPDQFQVVNPLFIIIFIPVFQICVYPVIEKFLYINTPLRKITVGGLLASLSFAISGIVEYNLEPTYVVQPSTGLAQIRIFNTLNCNASITIDEHKFFLESLGMYENLSIPVNGVESLEFRAEYGDCQISSKKIFTGTLIVKEKTAQSWSITRSGLGPVLHDSIEKSKTGDPLVRALIDINSNTVNYRTLKLIGGNDEYLFEIKKKTNFTKFIEMNHHKYEIFMDDFKVDEMSFHVGGVYTIVGEVVDKSTVLRKVTIVEPNSIHMFWLLPQYIVITMGEIMFSITGLEFAFTQAPASMKSLLQASFLLTVAFGNLIVVIIAEAHFFQRQVLEFFLFALLMLGDMLVFAIMAKFYKYIDISNAKEEINMQHN